MSSSRNPRSSKCAAEILLVLDSIGSGAGQTLPPRCFRRSGKRQPLIDRPIAESERLEPTVSPRPTPEIHGFAIPGTILSESGERWKEIVLQIERLSNRSRNWNGATMIHPFEDKNARAAGIAGAAMNVSLIGQLHRKGLLSDLDLSVILIFARIHLILEMPPELHDALAMLDRFRTPSVCSRRCPAPGEALTTAA